MEVPAGEGRGKRVRYEWAKRGARLHPVRAEQLGLPQDSLHGFLLKIWRVAELVEDALHDDPDLGPRVFAQGPIDGHTGANPAD